MKPIPTAIVAAGLIVAGQWARGKGPTIDHAIGLAGLALGMAVLDNFDQDIASGIGAIVVISLMGLHLPKIAKAAGLTE